MGAAGGGAAAGAAGAAGATGSGAGAEGAAAFALAGAAEGQKTGQLQTLVEIKGTFLKITGAGCKKAPLWTQNYTY